MQLEIFMKTTKLAKLFLASLTLVGVSATAATNSALSYNYAGLQYVSQDLDDFDCDQDGLNLYGSLELTSEFFARGSYSDLGGDRNCGSETVSIGAGYRTAFSSQSSIYGALSFEDTSVDHGHSDSGLIVAAGIRTYFGNNLEGRVEVAHHTAFDGDTEINGGLAYWFDPRFSLTGDVSVGSDQTTFAVGARVNF
jgi:hypothetical protein